MSSRIVDIPTVTGCKVVTIQRRAAFLHIAAAVYHWHLFSEL